MFGGASNGWARNDATQPTWSPLSGPAAALCHNAALDFVNHCLVSFRAEEIIAGEEPDRETPEDARWALAVSDNGPPGPAWARHRLRSGGCRSSGQVTICEAWILWGITDVSDEISWKQSGPQFFVLWCNQVDVIELEIRKKGPHNCKVMVTQNRRHPSRDCFKKEDSRISIKGWIRFKILFTFVEVPDWTSEASAHSDGPLEVAS